MTQKELGVNQAFINAVKDSIVYKQLQIVFDFPLAYRIVKYSKVQMLSGGSRIGDIQLKYGCVYVQVSGSKGLARNALFVKIGSILDFMNEEVRTSV